MYTLVCLEYTLKPSCEKKRGLAKKITQHVWKLYTDIAQENGYEILPEKISDTLWFVLPNNFLLNKVYSFVHFVTYISYFDGGIKNKKYSQSPLLYSSWKCMRPQICTVMFSVCHCKFVIIYAYALKLIQMMNQLRSVVMSHFLKVIH